MVETNKFSAKVNNKNPTNYDQGAVDKSNRQINVEFEDNILSTSDNNTYKFSLYLMPPDIFNDTDPRTTNNDKVTIAESGVSGRYFIKSVSVDSTIAPTFKLKSSQHNAFSMEIVEPKGFTLMDAFVSACEQVGIPNYMFAPYYLQLDFLQYNDDGIPEIVSNSSKIWAIKITSLRSSTSGEGTVYSLEAIEYEHLTSSNHVSIMDTNFLVECNTVGSFFKQLQRDINVEKEDQVGFWREFPDEVEFRVDQEIATLNIRSSEEKKFGPQNQEDTGFWLDRNRINVPKGMSVESIATNLMIANQEWAEKYLKKIEAKEKKEETQETIQFHKIWIIDVNIELKEFDFYVNDFSKKYIFTIRPYTSIRKFADPVELANAMINPDTQEKRVQDIVDEFNLRKRYEYIYTGKNTEVLNFDFDMNFLWVSHVPIYAGLHRDNALTDGPEISKTVITSAHNEQKLKQDLRKYKAQLREGPNSAQSIEEALEASENLDQLQDETERFRVQSGLTSKEDADRLRQQLANSRNKTRNINRSFASDSINNLNRNRQPIKQQSRTGVSPLPTTIVIDGDYAGNDYTWLADGTIGNYRSVAASILNNIHIPAADLMQIDMTIKGDPYWFGTTRTEDRLDIDLESIDTFARDNLFALRFRLPTLENSEGFQESTNSDVITGIYGVWKVVHNFSDGMFTQELSAFRDYNTNILVTKDFMDKM